LAWRLVALVGDVRWITPNLLTILSIISIVASAVLLCFDRFWFDVAATILLAIHFIFDCADGTLARYRGTSSALGAFLDKAGDAIGFMFIGAASGLRAYIQPGPFHGSPWIVAIGAMGGGFFIAVSYIYWIVAFYELKQGLTKKTVDPEDLEHDPVSMTWKDELKTILGSQGLIWRFNEGDFTFWVPVLVFTGRADVLAGLFFVTQGATIAKMLVVRGRAMKRLDGQKE
jgi:phosphatidylglycerophosphate synthase